MKSVKRNETHTGGRTGSNRVSLVFQHPPWARSSSAAFAKGEKRSNRYSVFVLSDVKRIGRDKTSGAEEGWNEPFHRGGALQFLRSTLSSFSIHRPLSFPISLKISLPFSLSPLSPPFSTFSTTRSLDECERNSNEREVEKHRESGWRRKILDVRIAWWGFV